MLEYKPSSRLAKHSKLDISMNGSTSTIPNLPPSILPQAAMEPLMHHFGFQPSSKLKMCPKLTKSSTTLPDTVTMPLPRLPLVQPQFQEDSIPAVIPPPQFYRVPVLFQEHSILAIVPPPQLYGVPVLASPFSGYMQEGDNQHVRFKDPLLEGTPLHLQQVTINDNQMEGIVDGNIDLHSPPPPPCRMCERQWR